MADCYCCHCGGRSSMMGHTNHNEKLLKLIEKLQEEFPNVKRGRLVEIIGMWQLGEVSL